MRDRSPHKWKQFATIYTPLVYGWCRRSAVREQDAADIVQEVFRAVFSGIDSFHHDQPGDNFRAWLWSICRNKINDSFRQQARSPRGVGGSAGQQQMEGLPLALPDSWGDEQQQADAELIYHRALGLIQAEFQPHTWQAFWRVVVEDQSPGDVAQQLGMSPGAVHNAKYKVLRRLRQEFEGLM